MRDLREPRLGGGGSASPSPLSLTPPCTSRLLNTLKLRGQVKPSGHANRDLHPVLSAVLVRLSLVSAAAQIFFLGGGVEWNFSFRLPAVAAAQLQPGSAARLHLPFQFQGSPSSELVLGQQKGLDILPRLQLSRLGFGSPSRPGKSNCGLPPLRCLAADPGVQIYPGLTNLATAQTLGPTATFGTPAPLRSSVMPPPRVGTSLPRPGRAWEGRAPCRGHCRG